MPWGILYKLEKITGNIQAAHDAWQKALNIYLSYRKSGGQSYETAQRLCLDIWLSMQQAEVSDIRQEINQYLMELEWQGYNNFLHKLLAILAGERDLALAEDESLNYDDAAELVLLLEELREAGL